MLKQMLINFLNDNTQISVVTNIEPVDDLVQTIMKSSRDFMLKQRLIKILNNNAQRNTVTNIGTFADIVQTIMKNKTFNTDITSNVTDILLRLKTPKQTELYDKLISMFCNGNGDYLFYDQFRS
jgi:hypothetical protein